MEEHEKRFIAHIRKSDGHEQTVAEHNNGVAKITCDIGNQYGIGRLSMFIGRHHDDGKNTQEYLAYLKAAATGEAVFRGSVIHSTHGALLANNLANPKDTIEELTAEIVRTVIMSHHGLRDCLSIDGRIPFQEAIAHISDSYDAVEHIVYGHYGKDTIENEFCEACDDANAIWTKIKEFDSAAQGYGSSHFYLAMYIRLLTSIVIDADRTNTACFEDGVEPKTPVPCQKRKDMWKSYLNHCEAKIKLLQSEKEPSALDQFRAEISKACAEFDGGSSGIFRLVVPCGAGKTLSVLRYALQTAVHYGKKHIFYIAPFNSILEQNANEMAAYIEDDDAVLRHHSNVIFDSNDGESEKKYKLLTENWSQSPVIATSAVQFLNTLFDAKTSSVRRMQALGDSVIIIDEIQALPIKVLKLFNAAMNFLAQFCATDIVFCSATQPLLDRLSDYRILPLRSIACDSEKYDEAFKRVEIVDCTEGNGLSVEEAADFILKQAQEVSSLLVILNTKPMARKIVEYIQKTIGNTDAYRLFHLSANMCPEHRSVVLTEIRNCLQNKTNIQGIICISTTLIEAGVDISFEHVIRSLTGLDSVVQAAGRCNRNRETECGIVPVIYIRDECVYNLGHVHGAQEVTREILHNIRINPQYYPGGALSKAAMDEFYTKYYRPLQNEMAFPLKNDPEHTILDLLTTNPSGRKRNKKSDSLLLKQAFKEAGEAFEVIGDTGSQDVIVEYNDDALMHIEKLLSDHLISEAKKELRYLQRYTVQLTNYAMQKIGAGVRFEEKAGIFILSRTYYHDEFGVSDNPKH
ncbi:MAG: CRISPR-associated helicase Cas3' [Lachnospiraceae bacterium]|nr:CRISPR-associated helicase Cas3' [Lachnospiraceae bacterium]